MSGSDQTMHHEAPWLLSAPLMRVGAVCAAVTAATTVLLWWLPQTYPAVKTFEDGVRLASDPGYMGRLWINFAHIFIALTAYGTAAAYVARRSPALALAGFTAMALWAFAEAIGLAMNIWAQNVAWRAGYATAAPATRDMIETAVFTFQGLWDGIFFVVLVGFLLGSLALGVGAASGFGLERAVGILFLLAVPLTAVILLDGYFGQRLSAWIDWSYPLLQPLSRAVLAWWLWSEAPFASARAIR